MGIVDTASQVPGQDAFNGGFNTVDFRGLSVDSFLYADRFAIYFVSSCRIYNEVIKIVLEICGFDAQLFVEKFPLRAHFPGRI